MIRVKAKGRHANASPFCFAGVVCAGEGKHTGEETDRVKSQGNVNRAQGANADFLRICLTCLPGVGPGPANNDFLRKVKQKNENLFCDFY